jgi:DNA sulfur modification protein DndB
MKVRFPALKGRIGHRDYYATLMSLSEVPRFFKFNDWDQIDPQARAQRALNVTRIPGITKYILDNEDGYIFSSITASYNRQVTFVPSASDDRVGDLEMDLEDMEFVINDGQHRAAAIAAALKDNPSLGHERISVLLFPTEDLGRLQQMFSDLNRFAHKTPKSLDILYDQRDNLSKLTLQMAERVPAFTGMIDKERVSIPLRSEKLTTLSALYDANSEMLGATVDQPETPEFEEKLARAAEYWNEVAKVVPDWERVRRGDIRAAALRQEKINTHSVVLRALGALGRDLLTQYPNDWRGRMSALREVDWRKSVGTGVNPVWDNVCIVAGSVVSNRQARKATQAVLKQALGLSLGIQEKQILVNLNRPETLGAVEASTASEPIAMA